MELQKENQEAKLYFELKQRRNVEPGQISLLCAAKTHKQGLGSFTLISLQCLKLNVMKIS